MNGYVEDISVENLVTGTAPTAKPDFFENKAQAQPSDDTGREDFHSRVVKIYISQQIVLDQIHVQIPTEQDFDELSRLLKYIKRYA